jgi:serine/threonine-protein kinase
MAEPPSPELVDSCALAPTVDPMEEVAVDRTMMAKGSGVKALPTRDDVDPAFASRYQMSRTLGRGGMGFVDGVYDQRTDRVVALKRTRSLDQATMDRFLREARVQARLEHPAIVPVYDVGTDPQGNPFFTMRRLSGDTLAEIVKKLAQGDEEVSLRWTLHERLQRFVDICLALEYAHQQGVLHRDLKPSNVMLGALGEVYVLDWGLAKVVDEKESAPGKDALELGLTSSGTVMGTPGYVAPEMLEGEGSSRQADVYALGAILFELLTLDRWHKGRSVSALVNSALESEHAMPRRRAPRLEIPPELDQACARATVADPRERTQSPAELAAEIRAYLEGNRDEVRRQELARECVTEAREAAQQGAIEKLVPWWPVSCSSRQRNFPRKWSRYWRRAARTRPVWDRVER